MAMTATSAQILRLAQWLSPSYPVGAFAYSHGLEWAVKAGQVACAQDLEGWLGDVLAHGAGRSDAIFLAAAYRAEGAAALEALNREARAFTPSAERRLEGEAQGAAFCLATQAVWPKEEPPPSRLLYPVAVGYLARCHDLPLLLSAQMYLHSFASNLISAGVRAIPIGQNAGQKVLAALAPLCQEIAAEAITKTPEEIANSALAADIASMRHETQYSRLFRS